MSAILIIFLLTLQMLITINILLCHTYPLLNINNLLQELYNILRIYKQYILQEPLLQLLIMLINILIIIHRELI